MSDKRKILVIENQVIQFREIFKLIDSAGYQAVPDEKTFKEYIDWIRIYLNPRYTLDRRNYFWEKILAKTKEFNPEVLIIDHVLVGSHEAEDGIDLAIKFRESGVTQPIIFFSRTEGNSSDICDRLPKVKEEKTWIFKGYARADILEPEFFEKEVIPIIEKFMNPDITLPTVVILTAIQEEYLAVRSHLKNVVEVDRDGKVYESGIFEVCEKEIARVFIKECRAGGTNASMQTERAIRNFNPDAIFFVGIAGSRKPNDFSIGDVVFPEKVYSYEGGRATEEQLLVRPEAIALSASLLNKATQARNKEEWKTLIKGNYTQSIKANLGVIASGEQLIEHYNAQIGQRLTANYNDTSAVDMESYSFAKTASETENLLRGVVRGISDILEQTSNESETAVTDRRPTDAKNFASNTAAAFAYWLIFKIYENKPMQ